jgi:hypothetical protein
MEYVAAGAFRCGYPSDILEPSDTIRPDADVVFVQGGPKRYRGANAEIIAHYEYRGTPVFMVEDAAAPQHVLLHKGNKKWLPPAPMDAWDRRVKLGFIFKAQHRGSKILVLGQGPEQDELLFPAIERISAEGSRQIVYRPHPNDWRRGYPEGCDGLTLPGNTLEADLNIAYAVVTHSSGAAHGALLRGIPVLCHEDATFKWIAHPLHDAYRIEDLEGLAETRINDYFERYAHIQWSYEELQDGTAFTFMHHFWR